MSDAPPGDRRARAELLRALASLLYPPDASSRRVTRLLGLPEPPSPAEHSDVLLFQVHPYASVYLSADGMKGGDVRDRTDGFWRAVGRTPPDESDHLGALLGLEAALLEVERPDDAEVALGIHAAAALQAGYVDPWLDPFLDAVEDVASGPFFPAWAALLREVRSPAVSTVSGGADPAWTDVPPLPDPRAGDLPGFAEALMAPARSGLIITRHALEGATRAHGVAARPTRRAWMAESFFRQVPLAAADWLAALAGTWRARHDLRHAEGCAPAGVWAERAAATEGLARGLAAALDPVSGP